MGSMDLSAIFFTALGVYGVAASVFMIAENRRPQATLAWVLVFISAPGIGLIIYILFGRGRKAFSRESKLLHQELEHDALPIMSPWRSRQDAEIARVVADLGVDRRLMMLVRRNSDSSLTSRNRVEILQDAAEFYPRLIEDMKAARHSIHHQYYIWRSDEFCQALKEIMIERAREGVQVRVLYDPLGSNSMSRAYVRELRAAGVRVAPTSPLYRLHTIGYRNHRKISVIDGAIAYTGGMNIGQEHIDGGEGFHRWRDTQSRIVGEAASVLQSVFIIDWYNAVRENLFSAAYFPEAPAGGDVPVQILTSGPDSQWAAIRQLYVGMIASAKRRVTIQSPFFIPDPTISEAMKLAALSGIDVRLMLSGQASGNRLPNWAGNTFLPDLAGAGVRVLLYQGGYLHAKTISVDGEVCSIGSANIDIRSFSINYELNAVFYDPRLAGRLERDFERDLARCAEFDPAEYRRRNVALRFRDSLARLVSPLL
ncbi:cardiolipin synthase [Paludisphaera sp.]|uniref:cardiolipin synthase n=1 Tax=Paludisphaera sp. TaxID=2017432 RepID=UPI00301C761F